MKIKDTGIIGEHRTCEGMILAYKNHVVDQYFKIKE